MNWVDYTTFRIGESSPDILPVAPVVADKLAETFLRRLPSENARPLIVLLPQSYDYLYDRLEENGDTSIGYPDLIEKVHQVVPWIISEELAIKVTDTFLASLLIQIPERYHFPIEAALPTEILTKMGIQIEVIQAIRKAA